VIFTLASTVSALIMLAIVIAHPVHQERIGTYLQFFTGQSGQAATFALQWGIVADPLAATMLITVALISLFLQLYAMAFIRREDGPIRFFCVLLLSTFAMMGVVLSTTYFEMLLSFGLISLSTYLMIGHWWQREESGNAAGRAFIISILGDVALLGAISYIYFRFNELNFQTLAGQYTGGKVSANGLFIMSIAVFIAAAAKSALFPLHVWLPASAQAPAPAAAFMHSAGSALCGVYLIARSYALFHSSPRALALLAIAGGVTALLGVLFALFQENLKRAIAYTTMGELGLMVLALGISAYGAAVFEAFAQAWPKALLFLAAGIIIRELRSERLVDMGGLWRRMPFTSWILLIALAAAAGIPPLSTFWSKDTILSKALVIGSAPAVALIVAVTMIGSIALFRIFFLVCTGETARRRRFEPERIRDSGGRVAFAMVLLAIPAVVGGVRGIRGHTDPIAFVTFPHVPLANSHLAGAGVTAVAAIVGALVAWLAFGRRLRPVAALRPIRLVGDHALYVEQGYGVLGRRGLVPLSRALGWADRRVVDGGFGLIADSLAFAGQPRRWFTDWRLRPVTIGFLVGVVALGLIGIVLTGRVIGATG
jgi:NADH-quinone oxidoreductase subunit L